MIALGQIPVTSNIKKNLDTVKKVLDQVKAGTIVVFPEGALTGYTPEKEDFISTIDFEQLSESHTYCEYIAKQREIAILIGSVEKEGDRFYNATYIFSSEGRQTYRKVNLAFHDKKHFAAGSALPIFTLQGIKVGVLMCREIMYPEQWRALALKGAQVLIHLNNTLGPDKYLLWKSYLISRAGENQRYVVSVNCAGSGRGCPTMVVSPKGKPIVEITSDQLVVKEIDLDLGEVQDYYLGQRRTDLVDVVEK